MPGERRSAGKQGLAANLMTRKAMISIITPVHNCLAHNQIFWESLKKYSHFPFELIVIDNASKDGSYEFFEKTGCTIIRNEKNICYPESINLGLARAQGDYICLLNNDVFCGVDWDKHLVDAMEMYHLDVVSPLGIERMPSLPLTHLFFKRWRKVGEKKHLRKDAEGLRQLLVYMYGDWEAFCSRIVARYHPRIMEGIAGNCVFFKRAVFEKIGLLDEKIQSADWDLYLTIKKRSVEKGDVHRIMTVSWAYVHHFIRTTLKSNPEPFACTHPRQSLEEKWDKEEIRRLYPFPHEVRERPSFYKEPIQYGKYKREKINMRRIRTEDERQWVRFWEELDRG
jgi:GT2 family glycosyltransferase